MRFCLCIFESDTVKSDCPVQIFRKMMKYLKIICRLSVILLPAHPAFLAHNFYLWDAKFLFQRDPGCNSIPDLSLKIVFLTHKFAVGLIDMGNSESQDP